MIPPQLQRDEFRFCKVRTREKRAYEPGWQDRANYAWNDPLLAAHLKLGGNYGAISGYGDLAILDLDDKDAITELEPKLPRTFTVNTSKGRHYYFLLRGTARKIILHKGERHIGELQAGRTFYVVGSGSTHPSGAQYRVDMDAPISSMGFSEMEAILKPYIPVEEEPAARMSATRGEADDNLLDVAHALGLNLKDGLNRCPWHDDKEPSLSVDARKGVFNCFGCGKKGGVPSLVMIAKGFSDPKEAGRWLREYNAPTVNRQSNANPLQEPKGARELRKEQDAQRAIQNTKDLRTIMAAGVPKPTWRVQNIVPARGITFLGATAGSYKTYLAMHLALSVATGEKFLDMFDTIKSPVLYIDEENGLATLGNRFAQLKAGYLLDEYPDNLYLTVFEGVKIDTDEGAYKLRQLAEAYQPGLIVLDSMVRLMQGEEDKATDVRKCFDNLKGLLEEKNCSVVILHHTRKADLKGNADAGMDALRGSGDFAGFADVVLMLRNRRGEIKAAMPKNRHVDLSQFQDFGIEVLHTDAAGRSGNTDEVVRFVHAGIQKPDMDRVERCVDDLREYAKDHNLVDPWRSVDVCAKMESRGHSKNTFYEVLERLQAEFFLTKVSAGKYQFIPGKFVVGEEEIFL